MPFPAQFQTPIPIFVPALSVAVVLTVLFLVGLTEQNRLIDDRVEQVVLQHENIAHIVSENIQEALQLTEASANRYAHALSKALADTRPAAEVEQHFDLLTETLQDGSVRSRRSQYQPQNESGIWIPDYVTLDIQAKDLFVEAKRVTDLYGGGAQSQPFVDTWVLPGISGEIIFWPTEPNFIFEAAADLDYRDSQWVQLTTPTHNPQRTTRWTNLIFDPVASVWMLSAVAPVYRDNQWVAAAGHDLPLTNLLQRTHLLRQSTGSYFALIGDDDRVVASARYAEKIKQSAGTLTLAQLQDSNLSKAVELAKLKLVQEPFQRMRVNNFEIFVAHIPQQNWLLVNAIPLAPIAANIQNSFAKLRNITLAALIAELVIATLILAWSHRRSRTQFNHLAQIQHQLASSEHHYRSLVDNIPGIVYRCKNDNEWTMLFVSAVIEKLTGYPATDFVHNKVRSFASIIHPDDRREVSVLVANAKSRSKPFVLEYRIVDYRGNIRWVLEHGRVATHMDTQVNELEGVILDITALKAAEEKLRELNDSLELQVEDRTAELRSAIRDLETFNYAVSHDLKAPVRQVTGFLAAIADDMPNNTTDEVRDMIRRSQNALKRMNEMIASLHAYSELNREALSPISVNINDLLSYMVDQIPLQIRQRVTIEIPPIDNVVADRTMLRIVLHNLIDNALKFSAHAEKPTIILLDHSTSAEWMLEVHDNGVGFNPHYTDDMFQLFQRLHPQEVFPGFGVGLALARKIMQLHGGRIWAESEPGKGASFFISIPVKTIRTPAKKISAEL